MFALVQAVIAVDELKQAALGLTGEPLLPLTPTCCHVVLQIYSVYGVVAVLKYCQNTLAPVHVVLFGTPAPNTGSPHKPCITGTPALKPVTTGTEFRGLLLKYAECGPWEKSVEVHNKTNKINLFTYPPYLPRRYRRCRQCHPRRRQALHRFQKRPQRPTDRKS